VPYNHLVMIGSPYKCISLAAWEYATEIVVAAHGKYELRAVSGGLRCAVLSVAEIPRRSYRDSVPEDFGRLRPHAYPVHQIGVSMETVRS
jgi:hypothetical protein